MSAVQSSQGKTGEAHASCQEAHHKPGVKGHFQLADSCHAEGGGQKGDTLHKASHSAGVHLALNQAVSNYCCQGRKSNRGKWGQNSNLKREGKKGENEGIGRGEIRGFRPRFNPYLSFYFPQKQRK